MALPNDSISSESKVINDRRKLLVLRAIVTTYILLLVGDFGYSQVIAFRARRFESQLEFDRNQIRIGCDTTRSGEGETAILFVHGFNDTPRIWDEMIAEFHADRGLTVPIHCVALRLPGFGSTFEAYSQSDSKQWITAVRNELGRLKATHKRVILVGHSLGGAIAIQTVSESPELVDGVALIAPANAVSNERSPLLSTENWHRIAGVFLIFTQATESPFPIDVHRPESKSYAFRTPFTPRKIIDETYRLMRLNRDAASTWKTKSLVVIAPADVVCDPGETQKFFDRIASAEKRLVVAENSGHAIPLDYDALKVTTEIIRFFELEIPSDSRSRTIEK